MNLQQMIKEQRYAQQRLINMLIYKASLITDEEFEERLNDHDMREMFSCIIDQTLCVEVIAYAKADDYVVTLHCYFADGPLLNVTSLAEEELSESVIYEVVDFEDAMRRINEVVIKTHSKAI